MFSCYYNCVPQKKDINTFFYLRKEVSKWNLKVRDHMKIWNLKLYYNLEKM